MTNQAQTILVVEDDQVWARFVESKLNEWGHKTIRLSDGAQLTAEFLQEKRPDIVLLDHYLPHKSGLQLLRELAPAFPDLPIVIMTVHSTVEVAVEAMKMGAHDFLPKEPFDQARMQVIVTNALKTSRMARQLSEYRSEHERQNRCCGMIGSSMTMQKVYRTIMAVADSGATVFITGESGAGKELVARGLHARGGRAGKPFVEINCGAIPATLMESELFGYEKGAFTGAHQRRAGCIEQAGGGTLFLDEICEMDHSLQVKLLRVLQEKTIRRLGGDRQIETDIRLIAATNRDPEEEVKRGRFREDLYYRLNVIPIHVPPLRDRADDIPLLAQHLMEQTAAANKRKFKKISMEALHALSDYDWPGNVRELGNVIERAVALNDQEELTLDMLPEVLQEKAGGGIGRASGVLHPPQTVEAASGEIRPLEEIKREIFIKALEACDGHVVNAAKKLKIGPNTLYRKIKEMNISI